MEDKLNVYKLLKLIFFHLPKLRGRGHSKENISEHANNKFIDLTLIEI